MLISALLVKLTGHNQMAAFLSDWSKLRAKELAQLFGLNVKIFLADF